MKLMPPLTHCFYETNKGPNPEPSLVTVLGSSDHWRFSFDSPQKYREFRSAWADQYNRLSEQIRIKKRARKLGTDWDARSQAQSDLYMLRLEAREEMKRLHKAIEFGKIQRKRIKAID